MLEYTTTPLLMPLGFKGSRDYVHGPDLYVACLGAARRRFGRSAWLERIKFQSMIRGQCQLVEGSVEGAAAVMTVRSGSESHLWSIIDTGERIELSRDFDEDGIVARARIRERRIEVDERGAASAVEVVVALTKRLHLHLRPRPDSRWIVVGFRFDRPLEPTATGPFAVELIRSLGDSLTVSEIYEAGRPVGDVTFSLLHVPRTGT